MIPAVVLFSGLDAVFAISAILGTILFIVRIVFMLMGMGHDISADVGHLDVGSQDLPHDHGAGTEGGFRLLTVNGLMGFFMIFGFLGLALHRGSGVIESLSIIGATAGGLAMMAVIAWLMHYMQSWASSGNIDVHSAIGQQATVYLTIPENGTGQVEVCMQNRLRIMDATSEDLKPIKTGERVEVVNLVANTLVVRHL
ncbi:NfeD family protein [bacterium]|nr:NfeD family protein [bacterium]